MEAFESDMESLWRNVAVMGVHLSEDMTFIIQEQTPDLAVLKGDADAVEQLEDALLEPLCQYARQADCSGAFVVLNTSLGGDALRSGLYIQRNNAARIANGLLLYRGMADVGRRHDVMPHRKWGQEFDLSEFPGFAAHMNTASAPIEHDCRTTELLTLPDTSERAILLTVPMLGGGRHGVRAVRFCHQSELLFRAPCSAVRHQQPCLSPVRQCGGAGYSQKSGHLPHWRFLLRAGRTAGGKGHPGKSHGLHGNRAFLCRPFEAVFDSQRRSYAPRADGTDPQTRL